MVKCSDVYKVQCDCLMKLERGPYIDRFLLKDDLIKIVEINSYGNLELAHVRIKGTSSYVKLGELSALIDKGFLRLENQSMTTCDTPKSLSDDDIMKYRLKALFREWVSKLNGPDIEGLLKLSKISPEKFGVDKLNKISWADPAYTEIAVDVLFEKIGQLP